MIKKQQTKWAIWWNEWAVWLMKTRKTVLSYLWRTQTKNPFRIIDLIRINISPVLLLGWRFSLWCLLHAENIFRYRCRWGNWTARFFVFLYSIQSCWLNGMRPLISTNWIRSVMVAAKFILITVRIHFYLDCYLAG